MPTNVLPEWYKQEAIYRSAKGEQKIEELEKLISMTPKHKATEKLLKNLRTRLAKFRKEQIKEKTRKAKKFSITVKKQGFQIAIIGFPNTGKSTLLKNLTNAEPKIAPYPFTTKKPETGMLGGIQLVEIPALIEKASEKQAELMSLVLNADGIILLADNDYQKEVLLNELKKFRIEKPVLISSKQENISGKKLLKFFNLIRVYTKEPGKKAEEKPIILEKGSTVLDVAEKIHKDFFKKLRHARVWGSARFPGQKVEKNFVLQDKDIVELHI